MIDFAKDAQNGKFEFSWPPKIDLPGFKPITDPHGKQVQAAAELILKSHKPILYVGGGVIRAEASNELLALAELTTRSGHHDLDGQRCFPRLAPSAFGVCRECTERFRL